MTLAEAIDIATSAHAGQVDKAGAPYIQHPLRVMAEVGSDEARQMAAILHDVVEDTPITLDRVRALGCPEPAVEAVDALTRRPGEPPQNYYHRVAQNPIARTVKLADIADNSNPSRLAALAPEVQRRLRLKYESALRALR